MGIGLNPWPNVSAWGAGFDPVMFGVTVITTLLGGSLIAAVLKFVHDRNTLPITREQMLSSASQASVDMALANAKHLDERLTRVERKLGRIQRAYNTLLRWCYDLINNWEERRQSPNPPMLPVDALLGDLDSGVEDENH